MNTDETPIIGDDDPGHSANASVIERWLEKAPRSDASLVRSAHSLAAFAHQGQTRPAGKDGRPAVAPYTHHTTDVAATLIKLWDAPAQGPLPAEAVAAALLHDSVEDQAARLADLLEHPRASAGPLDTEAAVRQEDPGADSGQVKALIKQANIDARPAALELIEQWFGARTCELVEGMTTPAEVSGPQAYAQHLRDHVYREPTLAAIKACDQLGNAGKLHLLPPSDKRAKLLVKYSGPTRETQHRLEDLGLDSFSVAMSQAADRIDRMIVDRQRGEQLLKNISALSDGSRPSYGSEPSL